MCSSPPADAGSIKPQARYRFGIDSLPLLLVIYLCAWWVIDPRLIHHSLGILHYYYQFSFHVGVDVFLTHLARFGGLTEYASRLLSQAFQIGWAGGLILTLMAWHASWTTDVLGLAAGTPRPHVLRWFPAVLLLCLYCGYNHPLAALLSLLAGLTAFAAYWRWAPEATRIRAFAIVLGSAILVYVAGSGGLIFPVVAATYELLIARRPGLALVAVACASVLPGLAALAFSLEFSQAYAGFLLAEPGLLPGYWPVLLALYLFFPTALAGTAMARQLQRRLERRAPKRRRDKKDSDRRESIRALSILWSQLPAAIGLAGLWAVLWFSPNRVVRTVLELDYYTQHEHWTQALAAADRLPNGFYDVRCNRNTMMALYHSGRLGEEMFRYPQRAGVDLFRTPDDARDIGSDFQEGRFFLDLGHVNQAEKCFCEALETCGDLPAVLEQLAVINVVKDRPETARIFLNALARHPGEARSAHEMLKRLQDDPALADDPRVSRIRENRVERDLVSLNTGVEEFLLALLDKNAQNRMAFELLMSHYLVIGRPDGVVRHLSFLRSIGYQRVPTHFQEAVVIYARSMGREPAIPGYQLDALVLIRAGQFADIVGQARSQEQARRAALAAGFGDSYYFYLAFGLSPSQNP